MIYVFFRFNTGICKVQLSNALRLRLGEWPHGTGIVRKIYWMEKSLDKEPVFWQEELLKTYSASTEKKIKRVLSG